MGTPVSRVLDELLLQIEEKAKAGIGNLVRTWKSPGRHISCHFSETPNPLVNLLKCKGCRGMVIFLFLARWSRALVALVTSRSSLYTRHGDMGALGGQRPRRPTLPKAQSGGYSNSNFVDFSPSECSVNDDCNVDMDFFLAGLGSRCRQGSVTRTQNDYRQPRSIEGRENPFILPMDMDTGSI